MRINIMSNQTQTAFETFTGTLEERGSALAKLEKQRVTSLEKANTKDVVFNGLAYKLGELLHELTLESDSGRISSERLRATSMNRVASQRRSEALQLYRNFDAIQEWLKGRVVKKRKQKIAFTSLTAMLKAFKVETQPKVEKTDTKVSEDTSTKVDDNPNVGTTDQPKKVEKVKVPQNSKEFAEYVYETTIKLGFDKNEVLEHIFNMFDEQTSTSKTGTDDIPF
jgi:hypothetical protein